MRLNHSSQLAGFAKSGDLRLFLRALCGMDYVHEPLLAPEPALFEAYKKKKGLWTDFESGFIALLRQRAAERIVKKESIDRGCLLCSEDTAEHRHRRLVVEYLHDQWDLDVRITHL